MSEVVSGGSGGSVQPPFRRLYATLTWTDGVSVDGVAQAFVSRLVGDGLVGAETSDVSANSLGGGLVQVSIGGMGTVGGSGGSGGSAVFELQEALYVLYDEVVDWWVS